MDGEEGYVHETADAQQLEVEERVKKIHFDSYR
jgi:hypothetical protein